jgi:hypothetical protein
MRLQMRPLDQNWCSIDYTTYEHRLIEIEARMTEGIDGAIRATAIASRGAELERENYKMAMTITPHETKVVVEGAATGFAQHISADSHRLIADEPRSHGGTNTGPTPYGLLLAALGS